MKHLRKAWPVLILFSFFLIGCRTTSSESTTKKAPAKGVKDYKFVNGKTTKAELVQKLGQPNGVRNDNGEETLTYNKGHITGKSFIPGYSLFGKDAYRNKHYEFSFGTNGVLKSQRSWEGSN